MKVVFLAVLLIGSACADWATYKERYNLAFSGAEDGKREAIYNQNIERIDAHNEQHADGKVSFSLAENQFTHMTTEEFARIYNGLRVNNETKRTGHAFRRPLCFKLPASVDWRTKGYVTPIKDQGQCGSCWAFSATGGLEGQHFRKTGKLVSLSEQNLVDCSGAEGNDGCEGGLMDQAFTYIKKNKGIDSEKSYPYTAEDGKCKYTAANEVATDTGFTDIATGNEKQLTEAIASQGPISVGIDASQFSFQFYSSGVYYESECSSTQLDHGVLAVGYGSSGSKDYYIVKNSWGTSWGKSGYIWMSRNRNNNCGIATAASYPMV